MGTCISVQRDPKSAMRFRMVMGTSRAAKTGVASGEGQQSPGLNPKSNQLDAISSLRSAPFGSKDEMFFDSRAWIDSDCEDDFFSVNGDFTPSRGSTPNYQTGTPMIPQLDKAIFDGFPDTRSEPSPRKKLGEFLQETFTGEPAGNDNGMMNGKLELNEKSEANEASKDQPPKSVDGTPYRSGTNSECSGERTPNANLKHGKGGKAMQCCLPSLVYSLSINERKKQTASPVPQVSG